MAGNWVRHALDQGGWQPQRQVAWLAVLSIIIGLIFSGVYLSQIANYATTNREIEALIEQRDRLERENEAYRASIAGLQTVPRLLERAEQLGYSPASAENIEYLLVDGYNPNRGDILEPLELAQETVEQAPVYDETFSGWLQQQWDSLVYQFQAFGR